MHAHSDTSSIMMSDELKDKLQHIEKDVELDPSLESAIVIFNNIQGDCVAFGALKGIQVLPKKESIEIEFSSNVGDAITLVQGVSNVSLREKYLFSNVEIHKGQDVYYVPDCLTKTYKIKKCSFSDIDFLRDSCYIYISLIVDSTSI